MAEDFKLYKGTYIKLKGKLSDYVTKKVFEEHGRIPYFIERGEFQNASLLYVPQNESKIGYLIEDLENNKKYVEVLRRNIAECGEYIANLGVLDSSDDDVIIMFYTPYDLTRGMESSEVKLKKSIYSPRISKSDNFIEEFISKYDPLVKNDKGKFYLPLTKLAKIKVNNLLNNDAYLSKVQDFHVLLGTDVGVIEAKKKLKDKISYLLKRFFK